jgi:glucan phosphorylase
MVSSLRNIFTFQQGKHPSDSTLKKAMKEEKIRKKDDKSVEQVLKALNSLETTEEKLAAMCKKYTDIVDENRKLQVIFCVNV